MARTRQEPLWRRRYNEWLANNEGLAAVEFALVAAPFFLLLFGLIEVCMVFILSTTLEHGVAEAAREIRTGQLQASGANAAQFKTLVCGNLFDLMDCDSKLNVDVRTFTDFSSADPGTPIKPDGSFDSGEMQFNAGGSSDIVLVRVFYEWEIITPMIGGQLSNLSGNKRLLQATTAFRNEPFGN